MYKVDVVKLDVEHGHYDWHYEFCHELYKFSSKPTIDVVDGALLMYHGDEVTILAPGQWSSAHGYKVEE